jgi:hypothetical protein
MCQGNKKLVKSHIIPEFMYKPLYDEKHRFDMIDFSQKKKRKFMQKGIREKLLCKKCEGILSPLEKYANGIFNGGIELRMEKENDRMIIEGLDYIKFKLFIISILWRASISNLDFFSKVKLKTNQENKLKEMILNNDPGELYEYNFIMITPLLQGRYLPDFHFVPDLVYVSGHRCYRFILNGIFWIIFTSKIAAKFPYKDYFLNENGRIINKLEIAENTKFYKGIAKDLKDAGII